MVAVHLLAAFITEHYNLPNCLGEAQCDNIGALRQASKHHHRISTGSKHSAAPLLTRYEIQDSHALLL
jgi:hypothetical protein